MLSSFPGLEPIQINPPDVEIATGSGIILLPTNDRYTLRNEAGALLDTVRIRDFYSSVLPPGGGVVDSEALFDAESGRFFIAASATSEDWTYFVLAASRSSTPGSLTARDWFVYALDGKIDRLPSGDRVTSYKVDGSALAIGSSVVVMTARMEEPHLGQLPSSQYFKMRVLDKAAVLSGTLGAWRDIVEVNFPGTQTPAKGLAPVTNYDTGKGAVFFWQATGCSFSLWALPDRPDAAALASAIVAPPGECAGNFARQPVDAQQPSGVLPLSIAPSGARGRHGIIRDGRLWVAHTTGWDLTSGPTTAVRWAELNISAWPARPTFEQQGLIADEQAQIFFPALAVNARGDVVMVFGRSGVTEPPSIWITGRSSTDPPNSMRTPSALKRGADAYLVPFRGDNRWGDYFGAAWDPVRDAFWVAGEYPINRTTAGTWVANVAVPPR